MPKSAILDYGDIFESYQRLREAVDQAESYPSLLAVLWRMQELDRQTYAEKHEPNVRLRNFSAREGLFGRVRVKNRWLFEIGAYQQPSLKGLSSGMLRLSRGVMGAHSVLDKTLSPRSKFAFLSSLTYSARLFGIADYVTQALSAKEERVWGVDHPLFDIALSCPALAWQAKNEFFRACPQRLDGSWSTCESELIMPGFDRVLDLSSPIDHLFISAGTDFFRGLQNKDHQLIRASANSLRKRAYVLSGNTSRLEGESTQYQGYGLESFPEAVRVVLDNEILPAELSLGYKVIFAPPREEVWLVIFPQHEFWFVETPTPSTLYEYTNDPIGFVKEHFDEIPRSATVRWSLGRADLLDKFASDLALGNYAHGLSEMIWGVARDAREGLTEEMLATQMRMSFRLAEMAEKLPPDLSNKFVVRVAASLLVDLAIFHTASVETAMQMAMTELVYEFLLGEFKASSPVRRKPSRRAGRKMSL